MPALGTSSGKSAAAEKKVKVRRAKKPAPPKVKTPPKAKVRQAQAQQQQYVSQGRAVEKAGNEQRKVRVAREKATAETVTRTGDNKSDADRKRAQDYVRSQYRGKAKGLYREGTTVLPQEVAKERGFYVDGKHLKHSELEAPVLKALEQTTRPLHGVVAAERSAIADIKKSGHVNPVKALKAAGKGLANKDKSTGSDVLGDLGVKNKTVKSVGGFALDVVGDPTTYVTGGAGAVARRAAEKSATRVEKKALSKGLTKEQAKRMADRARARVERTGDQTKGITVKVAGHELPGVRKATAVASKPVRKVTRKVVPQKARGTARSVAADVNPNAAPVGVSKETSRKAVQATRTARGTTNQGTRRAVNLGHGVRKQIGEDNYNAVVDAIESGKIGSLPPELRAHAIALRSEFKHIRRVQRRAGVNVGEVKHRKVVVPKVTADVSGAQKALREAQVARNKTEREHRAQIHKAGVAEGKARVLVGQSDRRLARSKRKSRPAGTRPAATLRNLETQRGKLYAMDKGSVVARVRQNVRDAEQHLEQTKATAAKQRGAQVKASNRREAQKLEPKGYVPRQVTDEVKQEAGHVRPASVIKPGSSKARKERRRLSVVREESPGKYREDLHALAAERVAEGSKAAAKSTLARDLADLGTPVKRGQPIHVADGEAVYHVKAGSVPREVTDQAELAKANRPLVLNKKGTKVKGATPKSVGAGRYVVLSKELVERSLEASAPTLQGPGIVHSLDKATSGFKRLAIATPGFHVRNLVGDTANAYLGQPAHRLPGNMRRARKVLAAHGAGEKAMRQLKPSEIGNATLKTKRYGNVRYDEVAKELAQRGAFRSGYIAGELRELSASGGKSAGRVATTVRKGRQAVGGTRPAQGLKKAVLNREDLPRLTTAMEALRKGATWEQAAQAVADLHFDYQHLTNFERQIARRAMPFYTWSARNIPLQARKYVTHPGKYANFQKVREEAAKASGVEQTDQQTRDLYAQLKQAGAKLPKGWEQTLTEWEQRNAGVPISWKGDKYTLSIGLPLQDLNELPGLAGGNQASEYANKAASLVTPILKDPVELLFNYSFFFRDQVQRDTSPLVAAPAFVAGFPDGAKKKLGVTKMIDKKTGKKVWAWPGKVDYVAHAAPGIPNYAQQFATQGTDRRGKGRGGKALAFAGLKSVPVDPVHTAVNLAYARMQEIQTRLAAIRQTGVGKDNPSAEWRKLNDQLKVVTRIAYQGKAAQGYKVLPTAGGPSKSSAGFKFDQGSQGFKFDEGSSGFKFH